MKLKYLLSGVAAATLLTLPIAQSTTLPMGATAAQAQEANVSINVFFDALADEGEWIEHPQHRYVWVPSNVDPDWAPYTRGHWAYTDRYGWTFVSEEPFAWAVYHYGRWGFDPAIGWYWVPGTTWAPAWVSWRRSNDVIGWAPLPPEGEGYAVRVDVSSAEPPRGYWHFVPAPEFLAPDLAVVIVRDQETFERTEPAGPVVVENNIVVNNVIDVDFVRKASGKQVQVTNVQMVKDPAQARRPAQRDAIVAVEGQLAEPSRDAAPQKVIKPQQVKAPTKGQDVDATTGSVKPGEETLPTGEDAGKATGGERAGETPEGATGQDNTNQGTATGEQPRTKRKVRQGTKQPGEAPAMEGQSQQGEQNQGTAAEQPRAERKVQQGTQGTNQPGEAPAMEGQSQQGEQNQGTAAEQPRTKRKVQQGTQGTNQPGEAPTVQGQRGDPGMTGESSTGKSAQKRLKKQSQGAAGENTQSQDNGGQGAGGVPPDQGQAAGEQAPEGEGAKGKGPRKLKSMGEQQPSDEQTGAIPGPKAKGSQGAEQVPAEMPGAAGPAGKGKRKGGCSAEQQAAGAC